MDAPALQTYKPLCRQPERIRAGASVQQGLSAAFEFAALAGLFGAADKRYSLTLMHKVSHLVDGNWVENSSEPVFALKFVGGVDRLVASVPAGTSEPFERLVLCMEAPYLLLYVLHTPRGEGEPGRYQCPELSTDEFRSFMKRFGKFLSSDARFDLWAYSPRERSTVVWDRHNELFCYGPIERFTSELLSVGFQAGDLAGSVPHQHHYRPEFDMDATELLERFPWSYSPLREEDEQ